jgi:hypothetical protein
MPTKPRLIAVICLMVAGGLGVCRDSEAAKSKEQVPLSAEGEQLLAQYSQMLASLKAEIAAALPSVDEKRKASFLAAHTAISSYKQVSDLPPEAAKAAKAKKEALAQAALDAARQILADVGTFLTADALDARLVKCAVLANATPRGLAEFAQQGESEAKLVDQLLADHDLMRQMLIAGGANGSEYGEAMQVYAAILEKSERARKPGIFQRLALGTSIHMPWLPGKEMGGVYGIVYRAPNHLDQVSRYLHYEKAFLDGELDSAVKDMTTWECRFITDCPYSDEELAWVRKMMRTYRPDHITNPDYKWRYARIVKSDQPYQSPKWLPEMGTKTQQMLAGGGKCGPRAFFGRFATRAFGIPSRASTQRGHGAMSHWTPDGWTICFGAWWSFAWCGPQGGLDFLLDSQAREHPEDYMQVLRVQWVGDALGEEDVSIRHYGKGGGPWNALAFYKKKAIVDDAKVEALELTGGMKLGESDELLGDEKAKGIEIPEEDRKIAVGKDGVITIPVAACSKPANSTDKVSFMKSWDGGTQVHYARLGNRPELLKYRFEVPAAGKYALNARVATVAMNQGWLVRMNRAKPVNVDLPYTKGLWEETKSLTIELSEGRNTLSLTCRAPNRGVSIKEFTLTPMP